MDDTREILDFIFGEFAVGIGVTLLIGAGFTLLADEFKAFKAARVCFYLATAWIYGKVFMWAYFTSDRFPVRAIVGFLAFGLVGVGLMEALRLTKNREVKTNGQGISIAPPVPAPAASPSGTTENHGRNDKVTTKAEHPSMAEHPGTADKPNVTVEHGAARPKPNLPAVPPQPTLVSLFNTDFPSFMKATDDAVGIEWKNGTVLPIKRSYI